MSIVKNKQLMIIILASHSKMGLVGLLKLVVLEHRGKIAIENAININRISSCFVKGKHTIEDALLIVLHIYGERLAHFVNVLLTNVRHGRRWIISLIRAKLCKDFA